MAKQTFTTGQVLTAAQMTSLQETAMGGGPATAKTASYVLVAADAGTTVAMNAAGATTITVNTGLFAAGDTVFIQNLGAGACTVTAGTATVATAGSLILPQNDAGILYFTATGAAIFYDYIQVGAASPLTTKGDLYTYSTSDTRLGVGANGTTLVADSSTATGLAWSAPGTPSWVGCIIRMQYNTSIDNNTATNIVFDGTDVYDTDGFHSPSSNNTQIIIPAGKAGKYLIVFNGSWAANTTGRRRYLLQLNGSTGRAGVDFVGGGDTSEGTQYQTFSVVRNLNVADYIEIRAYQNSGGGLSLYADDVRFELTYLGA